jgi:energy-coupling factor transport system permease protein
LLILGVIGVVVANRRSDAPWARAFKYYLFLALSVIAIRVVFRSVFGGDIETAHMHVLFGLPHIPLPSWAAGVQIGGPVTLEGTVQALDGGLQLGCLLCCLGAANALANPKRALRVLPGALYELGVAVVVSLTVAPQLVDSVQRVHRARKLRGGSSGGLHALRTVAIPVMEDALERSLRLAAAMDSRGYGRTGSSPRWARRITGLLMLGGMGGLCVGAYGLLDSAAPGAVGLPSLLGGSILCCAGLVCGSRRVGRSQYRPDPWKLPEWIVVACGLVPAVVFVVGAGHGATVLNPSVDPLTWPALAEVPAVAILVASLAAVAAPPPVRKARTEAAVEPARRSGQAGRDTGTHADPPVGIPA